MCRLPQIRSRTSNVLPPANGVPEVSIGRWRSAERMACDRNRRCDPHSSKGAAVDAATYEQLSGSHASSLLLIRIFVRPTIHSCSRGGDSPLPACGEKSGERSERW